MFGMKKRFRNRFIIFPLLNILLLFFFLFLHFLSEKKLTLVKGHIAFTRTYRRPTFSNSPRVSDMKLEKAHVEFLDLSMTFNNYNTSVMTRGKIYHRLQLLSASSLPEGIRLHFSDDVSLTFLSRESGVLLRADTPQTRPPITAILLPLKSRKLKNTLKNGEFFFSRKNRALAFRSSAGLSYARAPRTLTLRLDPSVNQSRSAGSETRLVISPFEGTFIPPAPVASAEKNPAPRSLEKAPVKAKKTKKKPAGQKPSFASRLRAFFKRTPRKTAPPPRKIVSYTDSRYQAVAAAYIDQAYRSLDARFNPEKGGWKMPNGQVRYNEKTAAFLLAESSLRKELEQKLPEVKEAKEKNLSATSYFLSPYLGNIIRLMRFYTNLQPLTLRNVRTLLAEKSPALLTTPGLVDFVAGMGLRDSFPLLREEGEKALASPDTDRKLSALILLNRLYRHGYEQEELRTLLKSAIEKDLLPAVLHPTEAEIFLPAAGSAGENKKKAPPVVSLALSLKAGFFLMDAGKQLSLNKALLAGRSLVITALKQADPNQYGFLPAKLDLSTRKISGTAYITPGEIYRSLQPAAYYPRQVYPGRVKGNYIWAWTAAKDLKIRSQNNKGFTLAFSYPEGSIQHFAVGNIPSLSGVVMHGIPWRNDPGFQIYSDGWNYYGNIRRLYFKNKIRGNTETVTVTY